MDVDCMDNCWILSPPNLPPPPPIPHFLSYLNLTIDCDLCTWAGVKVGSADTADETAIHLSSLLIVVGVISACCGAGIMAAILSIKRIRAFNTSAAVRHLARKESNTIGSAAVEGFTTPFSENTYCDGPYSNSDKDTTTNCNIYAELHEYRPERVWTRPRASLPLENCYLELTDLPGGPVGRGHLLRPWFLDESPNSSSYYSDLELMKMSKTTPGFHRP